MSGLQLVPATTLIDVPADVAVCPYCGAALFVQCEEWSQQDDGSWAADNVHADCTGEPDIDTTQWEEWQDLYEWLYAHGYQWYPGSRIWKKKESEVQP